MHFRGGDLFAQVKVMKKTKSNVKSSARRHGLLRSRLETLCQVKARDVGEIQIYWKDTKDMDPWAMFQMIVDNLHSTSDFYSAP